MVQQPTAPSESGGRHGSALDREDDRIREMTKPGAKSEQAKEQGEAASELNNPTQIEQDDRIDRARADAKAAGGGPDAAEDGVNQDG